MKYYLIGALILYPTTYLWALYDAWTRNTDRQEMIMLGYAVFGLLVLSAYSRRKAQFLLSRICIYLFIIMVTWIVLEILIKYTNFI